MAEVPAGKQINGFTGELEDAAPLSLNPSPADQRILSMVGDKPLAQLCAEVIDSIGDDSGPDVDSHVGPSLTEDSHPRLAPLPYVPQTQELPDPVVSDGSVQHVDILPANAQAVADGAEIADRTETQLRKAHKSATKAEKELSKNV